MLTFSDPGLPGSPTAHPRRAGLLHIFAGRSSTSDGAGERLPQGTDFRAVRNRYDKRQQWVFADREGRGIHGDQSVAAFCNVEKSFAEKL
jgi:hypothetical protein